MDDKVAEVRIETHFAGLPAGTWVIFDQNDDSDMMIEAFKDIFGFEPPDGDYEITFKLVNEIKPPEYDDCGRLVSE